MNALQGAWVSVASFLPELFGTILIVLIGIPVASFLGKLAVKLLKFIKFDQLVQSTGTNQTLEKIGIKATVTEIVGVTVRWFFIFVVLSAAIDVLNINQLSVLLNSFILYLPNVLVAMLLLILGLMGGRVVHGIITRSLEASKISDATGQVISAVAKWSVVIFSFMAALVQLRVAQDLIVILFAGIIAMLALAGGLAFGLGGKDKVRDWLEKM